MKIYGYCCCLQSTFEPPGKEFEDYTPSDWVEYPKFLDNIKDADYRQWALDLHTFWKELGRKMTDDVKVNGVIHSLVYFVHPYISFYSSKTNSITSRKIQICIPLFTCRIPSSFPAVVSVNFITGIPTGSFAVFSIRKWTTRPRACWKTSSQSLIVLDSYQMAVASTTQSVRSHHSLQE